MNKQSVLILALLVSVATNLVIAGFILGKAGGHPRERAPMDWAAESLTPDTQRKVRAQLRAQMAQARPLREEMRKAHAAVREAVAAEDFDARALTLALERSREVSTRYQAMMHENLVGLSAELSAEQRIALAKTVLQRGRTERAPSRRP